MPPKKNIITLLKDREYGDKFATRKMRPVELDNANRTLARLITPNIDFIRDRNYYQSLTPQQRTLVRNGTLTQEQKKAVLKRTPFPFI